jgi:hypothetical protein
MRLRVTVLISLGLNLAFAILLYYRPYQQNQPANIRPILRTVEAPVARLLVKTNVVVRRQNFTWQEIESEDYRVYIGNLRGIGCPESTIRDIIVTEVNALYDRKKATEILTPDQQWWRTEPDSGVGQAALPQLMALESERRALLTQLLGSNWEAGNNSQLDNLRIPLDGPVLGALTPEVKQSVRNIQSRSAERLQDYLEAQREAGKAADPAEVARLRQAARDSLARLLTPPQMEEYLLRYSQTAQNLRSELQGFNMTPEEFRSLFRARDAIDQQIQILHSGNDPASAKRREDLDRQREDALKQTLGPERYPLFKYNQDPVFKQAQASAQQAGAPPEAVLPLFQINQAIELERQRIRSDSTLTLEQRAAALANMLAQQQESLQKILGKEAYERYVKQR